MIWRRRCLGCRVAPRVDLNAEEVETSAEAFADERGVLADAGGEGERVEAAERSRHRSNRGPEPVQEDVEREYGVGVACRGVPFNLDHVAGSAPKTLQARLQVGGVFERVGGKPPIREPPWPGPVTNIASR